jgi:hypothetical protein
MVSVVALLCAAMIPRSDCTSENAIDVLRMGDAANELVCMRDSMMTLASLAIRAGPDEYWKVVCVAPDTPGPVLVGRRDDMAGR